MLLPVVAPIRLECVESVWADGGRFSCKCNGQRVALVRSKFETNSTDEVCRQQDARRPDLNTPGKHTVSNSLQRTLRSPPRRKK